MTFAKPALTVTSRDVAKAGITLIPNAQVLLQIPKAFWELETEVSDRAVCETDPGKQQILPYVTLFNEKNQVFVYGRGAKGGEQRLVGKLSLGLGGHVDTSPPVGTSLSAHLLDEAYRELKEEASLENIQITFKALISDQEPDGNQVPVGSVHLGLWGICLVNSAEIGGLEEGIIENGEWMDLNQLSSEFHRLENWSKMLIRELQDNEEVYFS